MKTSGIRAYWIHEPILERDDSSVAQRWVKSGPVYMPLIGPSAPEPERHYEMPTGRLEAHK